MARDAVRHVRFGCVDGDVNEVQSVECERDTVACFLSGCALVISTYIQISRPVMRYLALTPWACRPTNPGSGKVGRGRTALACYIRGDTVHRA